MIDSAVQWFFNDWAVNFLDPQKRLYWGYLISAGLIGFIWLKIFRGRSFSSSAGILFSRDAWLSKSARADYFMFIINSVILGVLSPKLLGKAAVAFLLFEVLHDVFGGRAFLAAETPAWVIAVGFTTFLFVLDDFARYVVHRLMHAVPLFWAFHKTHHSATSLNPITVLRTHPVESIIFSLRGAIVQGTSIALFIYCFGEKVSLVMVLGANIFKFIFNALGANLRHSEIPLGYWRWLEKILISPAQHQLHHSVALEHRDKNFGVTLALWDLIFNSHIHSYRDQNLVYGLDQNQGFQHSFRDLYWQPFLEACAILTKPVIGRINRQKPKIKPLAIMPNAAK